MSERADGYRERAAYVRRAYAKCDRLGQFAANVAFSFEQLAETVEFWEREEEAVARLAGHLVLRKL
jgi:hypothetical protein